MTGFLELPDVTDLPRKRAGALCLDLWPDVSKHSSQCQSIVPHRFRASLVSALATSSLWLVYSPIQNSPDSFDKLSNDPLF